jgi:two-component system nitrogen regulation response regulator GlnG
VVGYEAPEPVASSPLVEALPGEPLSVSDPLAPPDGAAPTWERGLEAEALALLAADRHDVWDVLTRRFESKLILTALNNTRGRRIEAAQKLGIGRNTITRKIQELGLE